MYPAQQQQQQQQGQQIQYVQQVPQQGQQIQYVQQVPQQGQQIVYQQPQQQMQYVQPQQQIVYAQPQQGQQVVYAQPQQRQQVVYAQPQQQYVQPQQQGQQIVYAQQSQQGQQQMQYVQQKPMVQQQQITVNQQQQQQIIKKKPPPAYGVNKKVEIAKNNPFGDAFDDDKDKDDEKVNLYEQADKLKDVKLDTKKWEQPRDDYVGTVQAHSKFNAKQALEDAKVLRKAMKGLGCDKSKIAAITGSRSHAQRLMIKNAFVTVDQELFGKGKNRDLLKDLKGELSGDFEKLVMGCYMEPGEYDARLIKKAVDGAGFNTDLLVEVLCTRTNKEIELMKSAWTTCLSEKKSMLQRCESETKKLIGGNNFQTLVLTILKAKRPANKKPVDKDVQKDAEELNRYITQEKKKEAKAKFIDVYTNRSWAHIGAIADKFQKISKKYTLPAAIKKAFGDGSDTSKALRVMTHFCSEPYDFWAQKLRQAMKGLGTDDNLLIRTVLTRCEIDMENVRNVFAKRYGDGQTLKKWIESDCSGSYRDLLNALCGYGI